MKSDFMQKTLGLFVKNHFNIKKNKYYEKIKIKL